MRKTVFVILLAVALSAAVMTGCTLSQQTSQPGTQTAIPANPGAAQTAQPAQQNPAVVQTTALPSVSAIPQGGAIRNTILVANTPGLGSFLTDNSGMTLYVFVNDLPGTSTCTAACLAKWPAFFTSTPIVAPPLSPADFSTVTRDDGIQQTAYRGRPLYYFSGDTSPGMTAGQGFNNLWTVAAVSTATVTTVATPAYVQTLSPNGGGSGGGGY